MASISTSIELYDRVSAPINNMISAINNMIGAYESVDSAMNTGFDTVPINEARQAIDQASQQMEELEQNIQDSQQQQENFNRSVQNGTSAMDGIAKKVMKMVAAYASIKTVENVLNISDELTQTTARLDMMNDGLQTTDELVKMVYQSAQNARGSFSDMADVVARFGNNAGSAFGSTEEIVSFANLLQKQMTIAGAGTQEASNAMLQLSQALGSGVLRGDELNSIFEQAPNLIQNIASYIEKNEEVAKSMAKSIDVSYEEMTTNAMGHIRELAKEGQLTGDIVKNAIFAASDEINTKFEQMPMTWGQVWTTMKNGALMEFQPVLQKVNELANNQDFQRFAASAVGALANISTHLLEIMELAGKVATFIGDNWSIIEPIIMGIVTALAAYGTYLAITKGIELASAAAKIVMCIASYAHAAATGTEASATAAATAAQYGFNAALLACPLTWIILLIITLITIIAVVCARIAKTSEVANSAFGVMTGGINVVIQFFKNLVLTVANVALGIWNALGACATNIGVAFSNAISGIKSWFYSLLSTALQVVDGICSALNKLPFVEFDYSGITSKASEYAAKAADEAGNKGDYTSISDAFSEGFNTFDTFQDGWAGDAFKAGAAWGDGVSDKVSGAIDGIFGGSDTSGLFDGGGYDSSQVPSNIADTAGNTGSMADALEITSEDLKYLRDIAETEVINRFTTAEVRVEMGGITNNISSDMDLDGVVDYLANGVNEAMQKAAEGVHD